MNTTTIQELEPASLELWGATLTSYFSAVGMVVIHYDFILTLNEEMRLVWPGPGSFPKALYYLNRYVPIFALLFCNYQIAGLRPPISRTLCQAWILVSCTAIAIASSSSTALLTLRVTALYRRVRWFRPSLWVAFVLFQGFRVSMMILGTIPLYGSLHYSPISNRCIPGNLDYRGSSLIAVAGILDALLLGLTLYKGIRSTLSIRTESGPSIMYTLVRDELIFFSVISSLRIANSVFWITLPPSLMGVGIYAEWGLESTLTSRFFLNLRSIAFHKPPSTFEDHTGPSIVFPFRASRNAKQSGQLPKRLVVKIGMDKTVHSGGGYLNTGDTPPEMFDLDVMDSQIQHAETLGNDFGSNEYVR